MVRIGNAARIFRWMRNQVSARTLANLLGVSEKAITQLAKRGVISPAPKGRYHLQASVYSYCAFLRAIGGSGEVESFEDSASASNETTD